MSDSGSESATGTGGSGGQAQQEVAQVELADATTVISYVRRMAAVLLEDTTGKE